MVYNCGTQWLANTVPARTWSQHHLHALRPDPLVAFYARVQIGQNVACEYNFEGPELLFCIFSVNVFQSQPQKFAVEVVWKLKFCFQLQPSSTAFGISVKAHEDCCFAKKWWWQCRWPASIDPSGSVEPWVPQWWAPAVKADSKLETMEATTTASSLHHMEMLQKDHHGRLCRMRYLCKGIYLRCKKAARNSELCRISTCSEQRTELVESNEIWRDLWRIWCNLSLVYRWLQK